MAGLVPAIHVCFLAAAEDVDARHKAGHDGEYALTPRLRGLDYRLFRGELR
jgi:hypothetical protein